MSGDLKLTHRLQFVWGRLHVFLRLSVYELEACKGQPTKRSSTASPQINRRSA